MARILIVDDDPDVVEAVSLFLKKEGHELASAFNREEGKAKVTAFAPDLIVLDVMMEQPDDGIALDQELRREFFKMPILMLTSVSKATGMEFGPDKELIPVDDFQEKPIQPSTLVSKVKELLSKAEG